MASEESSPEISELSPEETFDVLGNELRIQILYGLWKAYDPLAEDNQLAFSELYEMVDIDDSGQFNYHLNKLLDRYIVHQDDGYALSPVGLRLVQAIIAGAGQEVDFGPAEIETECRNCGGGTHLTYSRGRVFHCCEECEGNFDDASLPDGALWGQSFPPSGLHSRSPEEIMSILDFIGYPRSAKISGGICPRCSGVLNHALEHCEDHATPETGPCQNCGYTHQFRWRRVCEVCKFDGQGSLPGLLKVHPAVIAFQYRNDIDFDYPYRSQDFEKTEEIEEVRRSIDISETLRSDDPLHIEVAFTYEGERVEFVVNEDLEVIEISETG